MGKECGNGVTLDGSFWHKGECLGSDIIAAESQVECSACTGRSCCPHPHNYYNYVDKAGKKHKWNTWFDHVAKKMEEGDDAKLQAFVDSLK